MSSSCDLTTTSAVQSWLGQTSDAEALAALITHVSRAILSLLGRPNVLPASWLETRDGDGRSALTLRQWPVIEIARLEVDGAALVAAAPSLAAPLGPGYVLESAEPAPPGRMQNLLLRGARYPRGCQNVNVSYVAGYQISAEAAVVPAQPGPYAIPAAQPFGAWAQDCGVAYAEGGPLSPTNSLAGVGEYSVGNGLYSFSAADAGRAVLLSYGYVPADLAQAAIEWTAERYLYKSRIGQTSKTLGGQETASFDLRAPPPFVASLLQPYRRIAWPC